MPLLLHTQLRVVGVYAPCTQRRLSHRVRCKPCTGIDRERRCVEVLVIYACSYLSQVSPFYLPIQSRRCLPFLLIRPHSRCGRDVAALPGQVCPIPVLPPLLLLHTTTTVHPPPFRPGDGVGTASAHHATATATAVSATAAVVAHHNGRSSPLLFVLEMV